MKIVYNSIIPVQGFIAINLFDYAYLINENLKNSQYIEDIAKHILVEYN